MSLRIEDIDKNFTLDCIDGNSVVFCNVKNEPFQLYGLYNAKAPDEPFCRIPYVDGVNGGVNHLRMNTSGGRVRFSTDSPYIAIRVEIENSYLMGHMTLVGSCGFDLYSFKNGKETYLKSFVPWLGIVNGQKSFEGFALLPKDDVIHSLTLNFPLYNGIKKLEIGVKPGSIIDKGAAYRFKDPIIYYGSSITQGGCASRPGNAYPSLISHETNIDFLNLGFSGSCVAEEAMADHIASLPMLAFIYDYDYNAPSLEYLASTHELFYKRIRSAKPKTPIIILSAPFNAKENDDFSRRDNIKQTYDNAVLSGDENVYFIDGSTVFSGAFADGCTVDGVHPNDLGFSRIAEALLNVIKKALNI